MWNKKYWKHLPKPRWRVRWCPKAGPRWRAERHVGEPNRVRGQPVKRKRSDNCRQSRDIERVFRSCVLPGMSNSSSWPCRSFTLTHFAWGKSGRSLILCTDEFSSVFHCLYDGLYKDLTQIRSLNFPFANSESGNLEKFFSVEGHRGGQTEVWIYQSQLTAYSAMCSFQVGHRDYFW